MAAGDGGEACKEHSTRHCGIWSHRGTRRLLLLLLLLSLFDKDKELLVIRGKDLCLGWF